MKRIMMFIYLLIMAIGLMAQTAVQPEGAGTEGNPYQIANWQNLYWISQNSSSWYKHFLQTADIDFADATPAIETWDDGKGWTPIGFSNFYSFEGKYDGNNKTISGLFINYPIIEFPLTDKIGLFGRITPEAEIKNLGLIFVNVTGDSFVGGLVGYNLGKITNCYSTGNVTGDIDAGGLIGVSIDGVINDCYSTVNVTGNGSSGGLVGYGNNNIINDCYSSGNVTGYVSGGLVGVLIHSSITNCKSTGDVTGSLHSGGLVGSTYYCTIKNSNSSGAVIGNNYTGGLIGKQKGGIINNCNNTGNVSGGDDYTGGLVGYSFDGFIVYCYNTGIVIGEESIGGLVGCQDLGDIENCYSTGSVTGNNSIGGLIGINLGGFITKCFSSGNVTGDNFIGGLIGVNDSGTIENSFWDIETSGQSTSEGGTGKTTVQMKTQSTYTDAGWRFPQIWLISSDINDGYPYLNYQNIVPNDDVTMETPSLTTAVLHSAYPNPFNPSTTISFDLSKPETVKIEIYNIKGQFVKQLTNKAYDKGKHSLVWDGKNNKNTNCGTGIYFYRMTAGKTTQSEKMMLIK